MNSTNPYRLIAAAVVAVLALSLGTTWAASGKATEDLGVLLTYATATTSDGKGMGRLPTHAEHGRRSGGGQEEPDSWVYWSAEPLPSETKGLERRPEADNLVGIYAALADKSKEDVLRDFGNAPFSKFKDALAELASSRLTPIGGEIKRLMADPVEIDRILDDGARRAHAIADPILAMTKDIVGFIRS